MHNAWLENRRWLLRILVLIITILVVAGLLWRGESLLGAVAGALIVMLVGTYAADWIINRPDAPPPSLPDPASIMTLPPASPASTTTSTQPADTAAETPGQDPSAETRADPQGEAA